MARNLLLLCSILLVGAGAASAVPVVEPAAASAAVVQEPDVDPLWIPLLDGGIHVSAAAATGGRSYSVDVWILAPMGTPAQHLESSASVSVAVDLMSGSVVTSLGGHLASSGPGGTCARVSLNGGAALNPKECLSNG